MTKKASLQRSVRQLTPNQLLTERTRLERACVAEKIKARSAANQAALDKGMNPYDPELDRIAAEAWQHSPRSESKLEAVRTEIKRRLDAGDRLLHRTVLNLANRATEVLQAPIPATQSGTAVPVGLNYRSHLKRAIAQALIKNPMATDHEICSSLDEDGGVALPPRWKQQQLDRSFVQAYRGLQSRNRVEAAISTVRKDLRRVGLLATKT
jgi:hypothetical protein